MVAIARALGLSSKVLILDEPTSSLDDDEVQSLFAVLRRLRGDGMGLRDRTRQSVLEALAVASAH